MRRLRRNLTLLGCFVAAGAAAPLAAAETNQSATNGARPLRLTLRAAVATAVSNNLEMRIAVHDAEYARLAVERAGAAFRFDPKASFGFNDKSGAWTDSASFSLGKLLPFGLGLTAELSQSLKATYWTTDLTLYGSLPLLAPGAADAARYGVSTARLTYELARRKWQDRAAGVARDAENAYWDLYAARRKLANAELALSLARDLLTMNEMQVKLGLQSSTDLIEAQAAVAARDQDLIVAKNAYEAAADALAVALNLPSDAARAFEPDTMPVDQPLPWNYAEALSRAEAAGITLAEARTRDALAALELVWKDKKNRLDLSLDASVGSQAVEKGMAASLAGMSRGKQLALGLSISLGLPWTSGAGEEAAQARSSRASAALALEQARRAVADNVRAALRDAAAARARIAAATRARELARARLDLVKQKFNLKLASNTDVLTAQNDYLTSTYNDDQAALDLARALASLHYQCGSNLARHGITLGDK